MSFTVCVPIVPRLTVQLYKIYKILIKTWYVFSFRLRISCARNCPFWSAIQPVSGWNAAPMKFVAHTILLKVFCSSWTENYWNLFWRNISPIQNRSWVNFYFLMKHGNAGFAFLEETFWCKKHADAMGYPVFFWSRACPLLVLDIWQRPFKKVFYLGLFHQNKVIPKQGVFWGLH